MIVNNKCAIMLILFSITLIAHAENIVINHTKLIDKDTTYQNTSINLMSGSFQVVNNATLTILDSNIEGSISSNNPALFSISNGRLILKNNTVNIKSDNVTAQPTYPAIYYAIDVIQGNVDISGNKFNNNKDYTVGLMTNHRYATNKINFINNIINHFHGGLLLSNSNFGKIENNKFNYVSSSNIFLINGSDHIINGNTILFSGNNNVGDAIDITDSSSITISHNFISSGSCYSLMIINGRDISIHHNAIISGITYAINIVSSIGNENMPDQFLHKLIGKRFAKVTGNANISINNNYLSQNRFGITTHDVNTLIVKDNLFIQKFTNADSRKFWTNNDVLLNNTVNVTWEDNLYKEAYSQDPDDNNSRAEKTVTFPLHGGVIL